MNGEGKTPVNPQDELRLKLPEPDVSPDSPWHDDLLGRAEIGERLTQVDPIIRTAVRLK